MLHPSPNHPLIHCRAVRDPLRPSTRNIRPRPLPPVPPKLPDERAGSDSGRHGRQRWRRKGRNDRESGEGRRRDRLFEWAGGHRGCRRDRDEVACGFGESVSRRLMSSLHAQRWLCLGHRAVMLGMPSNQAKDAIAYTPRAVLLKARESGHLLEEATSSEGC